MDLGASSHGLHKGGGGLTRSMDWRAYIYGALVAVAAVLAYHGTFKSPMFFDDIPAIVDNQAIRKLSDIGAVLSPIPSGSLASGATGRPLVNLSLAINFALSGLNPWSYHALNLVVHIGTALALFGILHRTFAGLAPGDSFRPEVAPRALAFAATLVWTVHPLLTETVTCIIQRTEGLMGLFYLLTVYGFIRYSSATAARRAWASFAFVCCLLGMAAKEAMVTAPLIVLFYDRTFVSRTFQGAFRRHGRLHLALASTWMLTAYLVIRDAGGRGNSAGFGDASESWHYLLTQCDAIPMYLRLSFWPHPLVVDYGTDMVTRLTAVWPGAILIVALLGATIWAFFRHPKVGFAGLWFFIILGPSSSIVTLGGQTIAEHRMYLPLASLVALSAVVLARHLGRAALPLLLASSAILAFATEHRNRDYSSEISIWTDTARNRPGNFRVRVGLGMALLRSSGHTDEAITEFTAAVQLKPTDPVAHNDLGLAYLQSPGRAEEAVREFRTEVALKPNDAVARNNLGLALLRTRGRSQEAIGEFSTAIRLDPRLAGAHVNLADAYAAAPGMIDKAIGEYEEALKLDPGNASVHFALGSARLEQGSDLAGAIKELREAVNLDPALIAARFNLGVAFLREPNGKLEAEQQFDAIVQMNPQNAQARRILDAIRASMH